MAKYVALLRGINVGGRQIKMDALRKTFEGLGAKNIKTLLASGNVVFETRDGSLESLRRKIEARIEKDFGFEVSVILRGEEEINQLIKSDPFKGVKVTPKTRLFITFLSKPAQVKPKIPVKTNGDILVGRLVDGHITTVLTGTRTPDAMDQLVKLFGRNITTRNWNTVQKIAAAMGG